MNDLTSEFDNELRFEEHIRSIIYRSVQSSGISANVIATKRVADIIVCRNDFPSIFLIEIKYHKKKHGRLGIGHGKGGGFQPEIIKQQPLFLESQMRWILGAEDHIGKRLFLKNSDISRYLSGGKIEEKFNNIKRSVFADFKSFDDETLLIALSSWFSGQSASAKPDT